MEHRNGTRIPINIPVELWRNGACYGHFMSRDIGHGGILLKGCGALKKGDFLTAKITNNHSASPRYYQPKVIVVHSTAQGVGLMWADYTISFFDALDFMLSAAA